MTQTPHESDALQYGMYRTIILCWRCWCRYEMYSPGEFADDTVLRCDRCGAHRISDTYGGIGVANRKFLDVHYPSIRGWGGKKEDREFLKVFEEQWAEKCPCGGYFRVGIYPPCPRCHSKPFRWLSWSSNKLFTTPPIPTLKFTIPPEYVNAPARPFLHPEPEVFFVPGPLPDAATAQAQRAQADQETIESRMAFEGRIATLVQEQLAAWAPRLTQAGLTLKLGSLVRGEETKHIRYSSECPLIVHRGDQLVETVRFYVYHAGRRAATEAEFTSWLDRTLQLLTEGKLVSKFVP